MPQDNYTAIGRALSIGDEQRWLSIYNDTGERIPPFSFVTPVANTYNGGFKVQKIAEAGDTLAMVTGPIWTEVDSWGVATRDFPTRVAYEPTDGTPAANSIEDWGPAVGEFKARKNKPNWKLIGPGSADQEVPDMHTDTAMIEAEICRV